MKPPEDLVRLGRLFQQNGARLYAVGGWVRDGLLGREQGDLDLACAAVPETLSAMGLALWERSAGLASYTLAWGERRCELTCFRRESCRDNGAHRPRRVETGVTLEEDALRRDFTVNALYLDLVTGEILDPTGGLGDLARKRLVTPREPGAVFSEDALRILRLARFWAKLGMEPEEKTLAAARARVGTLDALEPARLGAELKLLLPIPGGAERLRRLNAWPVLWPEGTVTEAACKRAEALPPDAVLRMAGLLWYSGIPTGMDRLMALQWSRQEARRVEMLLRPRPEKTAELRALLLSGDGAGWVAVHGEGGELLRENLPASPDELPISGQEMLALSGKKPGPWMGEMKRKLWQRVLEDPQMNDREKLMEALRHGLDRGECEDL